MNNSSQQGSLFSRMEATPRPLILTIRGLIPGKKNNKMVITKSPRGKPLDRPLLITDPAYQKSLEKITESLRCQLLSACQTESGATLTASCLQSWIASRLPADDAWTHVPEMDIRGELCRPGEEGATITVQRI